jgi:hypothetical protein
MNTEMDNNLKRDTPAVGPEVHQGDDLLWGCDAIARHLKLSSRKTYHLIETRQIPAGKIGGRHVASRKLLREHFAAIVGGIKVLEALASAKQ